MKACSTCGSKKSLDNYYADARCRDGYRGQCKACTLARTNEWRDRNRDSVRAAEKRRRQETPAAFAERQHRHRLRKTYNLTPEQYDKMLAAQDGCCAICHKPQWEFAKAFAVDHDHACCPGKTSCGECVRALLCTRCNPMIGFAQDDPERLIAAAAYLIEYTGPALEQALGATV